VVDFPPHRESFDEEDFVGPLGFFLNAFKSRSRLEKMFSSQENPFGVMPMRWLFGFDVATYRIEA
jgi:hypothetical protein